MISPKDVLLHVLTITGYSGNKEEIVAKYLELTAADAVNSLLLLKPEQEQEKIIKEFADKAALPKEQHTILNQYFEQTTIDQAFQTASQNIFTAILDDLIPTLSQEERRSLKEYLDSLIEDDK